MDRRRPRRGQRHADRLARGERDGGGSRQRRRQAAARARSHAAFSLSQAARARDHGERPARPADDLRGLAEASAAAHQRRPARSCERRPAAAHQRRRAGARAGIATNRLAAPLPGACARPRDAGRARCARKRHHGRGHPLRADRGAARPRAGQQRVAHARLARRQEPRGAQRARGAQARGEPANPDLIRPVPAGRASPGRDRGSEDPRAARAARRARRAGGGRGFLRAGAGTDSGGSTDPPPRGPRRARAAG